MMELKVCLALCALLLFNCGSAELNEELPTVPSRLAPATEAVPVIPATDSANAPSLDVIGHEPNASDTNPSLNSNSSATNKETAPTVSIAGKDNETKVDATTQPPPVLPAEAPAATALPSHPVITTTTSATHIDSSSPVDSPTAAAPSSTANTSQNPAPSLPESRSSVHPVTINPPAPTSTPNLPKLNTSATQSTTQPTPTSNSSHETTNSPLLPHSPTSNSRPEAQTKSSATTTSTTTTTTTTTTTAATTTTTTTTSSSPSPQAKAPGDNSSQFNVGSDPTMVHDPPTLDPLLAGLVSAFIITAVIITLFLFLKLRRRDNRPEFRRLQDLPMDDMMEDTPLSMYSY